MSDTINGREVPEWGAAAKAATGGRGADIVVETAGSTLPQALSAVAFCGFVGVIGFVGGTRADAGMGRLVTLTHSKADWRGREVVQRPQRRRQSLQVARGAGEPHRQRCYARGDRRSGWQRRLSPGAFR